jgi:hypothetical protein
MTRLFYIILFSASNAAHGFGGESVWIVSGGTSAGLNLQTGTPQTSIYDAKLAVGHSIGDSLELLLFARYLSAKTEEFAATSQSDAGVQLNWTLIGSHLDAFYLGARAGSRSTKTPSLSASSFFFGDVLGKRISLGSVVSFDPEVSATWYRTDGSISSPAFQFIPVQFTLFF